jgi:hypothetical protein
MGPLEKAVADALESHVEATPYGQVRRRYGESPEAEAAWSAMSADERFDLVTFSLSGVADALGLLARVIDEMRNA